MKFWKRRLLVSSTGVVCILLLILQPRYLAGAQETNEDLEKARSAAELVGLEMTQEELEALSPSLEAFRKAYQELRELEIPNDVSPSLYFNPIPKGYEFNEKQGTLTNKKYLCEKGSFRNVLNKFQIRGMTVLILLSKSVRLH